MNDYDYKSEFNIKNKKFEIFLNEFCRSLEINGREVLSYGIINHNDDCGLEPSLFGFKREMNKENLAIEDYQEIIYKILDGYYE